MKEENNSGFDFDNAYEETVGFFSGNFYRKDNVSNEKVLEETKKETQAEDVLVAEESVVKVPVAEEVPVEAKSVVEEPAIDTPVAASPINEFDEQLPYDGTFNVFISPNEELKAKVEVPKTEEKKENPVAISNAKVNNQQNKNVTDSCVNANEISQKFFEDERIRLVNLYSEKKKKTLKIGIFCLILCFLVIPLFLAPIFIIKAVKYGKLGKLNHSLNYSTLKWDAIKTATTYEVYFDSGEEGKFKLYSSQKETKCSLTKGSNKYVVVAKNQSNSLAVSDIISVSI